MVCGALSQCTAAPEPQTEPASPPRTVEPAAVAEVTAAELGPTWHPGCPVAPAQLRRVTLTHLGFDDRPHRGELIVHRDLVAQVIALFDRLYRLGFPIEKMRPVATYRGGDDELSMADDNTSAFNCRRIPGSGNWALHAYGRAIDINPLLNPSVDHGAFEPHNARVYLTANGSSRVCCTPVTPRCGSSPMPGGLGAATGSRRWTISTSSGAEPAPNPWPYSTSSESSNQRASCSATSSSSARSSRVSSASPT